MPSGYETGVLVSLLDPQHLEALDIQIVSDLPCTGFSVLSLSFLSNSSWEKLAVKSLLVDRSFVETIDLNYILYLLNPFC